MGKRIKICCLLLFFNFFLLKIFCSDYLPLKDVRNNWLFVLNVSKETPLLIKNLLLDFTNDFSFCLRTQKEPFFKVNLPLNIFFHFPSDNYKNQVSGEVFFQESVSAFWQNEIKIDQGFTWDVGKLKHIISCLKTFLTQVQFAYSKLIRFENAEQNFALSYYKIKVVLKKDLQKQIIIVFEPTPPFHFPLKLLIETPKIKIELDNTNKELLWLQDLWVKNLLSKLEYETIKQF